MTKICILNNRCLMILDVHGTPSRYQGQLVIFIPILQGITYSQSQAWSEMYTIEQSLYVYPHSMNLPSIYEQSRMICRLHHLDPRKCVILDSGMLNRFTSMISTFSYLNKSLKQLLWFLLGIQV